MSEQISAAALTIGRVGLRGVGELPGLTVAMPVYNGMPYLPKAVESILGQTLADFEFIVVDDGSNDGSRQYLESLDDSRIRLYCGPRAGATAARNRLLELTATDICALMDADDIAVPGRLHMQWNVIRERPELVLLGTQIEFMAGGRTFAGTRFPTEHAAIVRALNEAKPVLCHPACMFRTDAAVRAGGYRLPYGEEFDFFLRLSEEGKVANLPDKLLNYRIHLGSTFATQYPQYKAHIAYAISCYRRRLAGEGEMPLTEFLKRWDNCSWGQRMWRRLDAWSARRSRQALIEIGGGRRFKGSIQLAAAAACRPRSAARQMLSRVSRIIYTVERLSKKGEGGG